MKNIVINFMCSLVFFIIFLLFEKKRRKYQLKFLFFLLIIFIMTLLNYSNLKRYTKKKRINLFLFFVLF